MVPRLTNLVATTESKPYLLTGALNFSRVVRSPCLRQCPVLHFNKQMATCSRIMPRIAGNNINAMEHSPTSHCLDPIRRLGHEIKKESYLLCLKWKLLPPEEKMPVLGGRFHFPGGWLPSNRGLTGGLRF